MLVCLCNWDRLRCGSLTGNSLAEAREVSAFTGRELPPSRAASSSMAPLVCESDRSGSGDVSMAACNTFSSPERGCRRGPNEICSAHEDTSSLREYMQRFLKSSLCYKDPLQRSSLCEVTHQKNILSE